MNTVVTVITLAAFRPVSLAPTSSALTTSTSSAFTTSTSSTSFAGNHYSMLEYAKIIEKSYNDFFNDDIFGFYPQPVLEGFTEKEFEEMCYYKGVKDNYESLTVEKINDVASDYAEEKGIEMYELLDEGWEFIEEISKRLAIPAVLLYESDSYSAFESEIDGL